TAMQFLPEKCRSIITRHKLFNTIFGTVQPNLKYRESILLAGIAKERESSQISRESRHYSPAPFPLIAGAGVPLSIFVCLVMFLEANLLLTSKPPVPAICERRSLEAIAGRRHAVSGISTGA
ncbi:MAG TPA: hypothetical protein O0X97_05405, partial [Methanocorpusculum sp.]|nr:hypothetical protein [Methanocorpusculum sp.]